MTWGGNNDESPRTEALAAAERAYLEAKGLLGEQPAEPVCRCPRPCWCQGDVA